MTLSLFDEPDLFGSLEPANTDRYYQLEAVDAVFANLKTDRSTLVDMATGLGKTRVISMTVRRWTEGRILALAHRDELVGQMRDELERATGAYVEIEQAQYRASSRAQIVVASTQTLTQQKRLDRFGKDHFAFAIADEAHHYIAPSYRKVLDFFESAKVLGVTATPDRADEAAMGQVFDSVAYVLDIEDGIDIGYLVPIVGKRVHLDEIDLTQVKTSKGDLAVTELDEVMLKAVEGVVAKTLDLYPDRQGIAFFPGVRSAEYAMQRFNQMDPDSTIFIDGMTDKLHRKRLVEDFKAGRYKRLCNCGIATEGFDAPGVSLIAQARPTKSRALYCQMTGRATRVLPGVVDHLLLQEQNWERQAAIAASKKKDCVVLDFVGNSGKHSLVTLEDALGGKFTEQEIERAKTKRAKAGDSAMDAREALLESRRELIALAKSTKAKVSARVSDYDPFKVLDLGVQEKDRYAQRFGAKPAYEWQLDVLRAKGIPESDLKGLSYRGASKLLDEFTRRRKANLATYKQMRQLQRFGVNDRDVSFERASAALNYITAKGWGRDGTVDPKELRAIIDYRREAGEEG